MFSGKKQKWIAQIALLLGLLAPLAACNTMEGAGEDIQDAGEAIEEEAED